MPQCLHINEKGRRCRREAEDDSTFCRWHAPEPLAEPPLLTPELWKLVLRIAALLVLAAFLFPLALQGYWLLRAWLN